MARMAVVKSSELGDRMDAGFHITRTECAARVAELEKAFPGPDGVAVLARAVLMLTPAQLQTTRLSDLYRGSGKGDTRDRIERAVHEYPYLSFAVCESVLPEAMEAIRSQISALKATLANLVSVQSEASPVAPVGLHDGYVYPLCDPESFDDEDEQLVGYRFAVVPRDAGVTDKTWLADMWIVNESGEVHPGMNANPVPVRKDAVQLGQGRPFDGKLPEPVSVMDSPFLSGRGPRRRP